MSLSVGYVADYRQWQKQLSKRKWNLSSPKILQLGMLRFVVLSTDVIANKLIGTGISIRYGQPTSSTTDIPGFLFFLIWLPSFLGAIFLLLFHRLSCCWHVSSSSALHTQGQKGQSVGMPHPELQNSASLIPPRNYT